MNDYDKNYFWTMEDPDTGNRKYYFRINGIMVEVSKDVYNVCFSSYVKELRKNRKKEEHDLSLDYCDDDEHSLLDTISTKEDVEKEVTNKIMHEIILEEIQQLNDQDRKIILDLVIEEKSLRALSKEMELPVMTLYDRKKRILKKIKAKLMK